MVLNCRPTSIYGIVNQKKTPFFKSIKAYQTAVYISEHGFAFKFSNAREARAMKGVINLLMRNNP